MDFVPSKADPDVWMRPNVKKDGPGTPYYEYIACYDVDDIIAIGEDATAILEDLQTKFKFKKDLIATPTDFIGAQLERRTVPLAPTNLHGWAFDGKKCVKGAIDNVEMTLQKKGIPPLIKSLKGKIAPFTSDYQPEIC